MKRKRQFEEKNNNKGVAHSLVSKKKNLPKLNSC